MIWEDDNEALHCVECGHRWREDAALAFLNTHQCPECREYGSVEPCDLAPFVEYDDAEEGYDEEEEAYSWSYTFAEE